MKPKDKAKELINKMHIKPDLCFVMSKAQAIDCALIAVDEIISLLSKDLNHLVNYWFEVKQEIEKL